MRTRKKTIHYQLGLKIEFKKNKTLIKELRKRKENHKNKYQN